MSILDIGDNNISDPETLSFCNEWELDIGDIRNGEQDALSLCNKWALDIGDIKPALGDITTNNGDKKH